MPSPPPIVEAVLKDAIRCRSCFSVEGGIGVQPALIDLAQPRWVGPNYLTSSPRVLAMMLNPGEGKARFESNSRFKAALEGFRDKRTGIDPVFEFMRADMETWGRGRFMSFLTALGLSLDTLALANAAWCATKGDKYPSKMLASCFGKHTQPLLFGLSPQVVVLMGTDVHGYRRAIQTLLPGVRVISTLHYGHREGAARETAEVKAVRDQIELRHESKGNG